MINDKVIVIAGGAGLLGKAFSQCVYANGGKVVILDSCESKKLDEKEIPYHFFKSIDISSKQMINKAISDIKNKFGKIDALVNTAYPKNKNYGNHFFDVTIDDFNENVSMHLGGYFLTCQMFSKYFIKDLITYA